MGKSTQKETLNKKIMQKSNPKHKIVKEQSQLQLGMEYKMDPFPEFDDIIPENEKLLNKKCIITGGDSGIGKAVTVTKSFSKPYG